MDDFTLAGTEDFINEIITAVSEELTVSKIEKDSFRYTGIDVKTVDDGIEIEMQDYVNSLDEVREIRKADKEDPLTKAELKVYR